MFLRHKFQVCIFTRFFFVCAVFLLQGQQVWESLQCLVIVDYSWPPCLCCQQHTLPTCPGSSMEASLSSMGLVCFSFLKPRINLFLTPSMMQEMIGKSQDKQRRRIPSLKSQGFEELLELPSDPREENFVQDMVTIFSDDYSEFFF